ncbi:uncharacterized protein F5147DRAFT_755111 [Suillus discolor]|uniref:Uncharacterized protein n=1 Tax=Suillus discolor TaxID=1912936 RepID=A0A9P7JPL8_9AGAM|nr:uncharacterized protein F5147DRAFT_755111 [Suillus discolor]KAG2095303.1 hypothetical protein F5147DRAFT_755111 [Suillus discolor]
MSYGRLFVESCRFCGGDGVAGTLETNMDRCECLRKLVFETSDLAKVISANDAKDTQLTITPTHSDVQHEVSLKIGPLSENVRDKDTSKERMVVQSLLPQIQADAIPSPTIYEQDEANDGGYWNWSYWDPDTKQYSFQLFRLTC